MLSRETESKPAATPTNQAPVCHTEGNTQTGTFAIGDGRYFVRAGNNRHPNDCQNIMNMLRDKHNATATGETCVQDQLIINGKECGNAYYGNPEAMVLSDYYQLYYGSCRPASAEVNAQGQAMKGDLVDLCNAQKSDSRVAIGVAGALGGLFLLLLLVACYRSRKSKAKDKRAQDIETGAFQRLPGNEADANAERKVSLGDGANTVFGNASSQPTSTPPATPVSQGIIRTP